MKAWIGDRKEKPEFATPGNIVFLTSTATPAAPVEPAAPGALTEAFIAGTQPGAGFGSP